MCKKCLKSVCGLCAEKIDKECNILCGVFRRKVVAIMKVEDHGAICI